MNELNQPTVKAHPETGKVVTRFSPDGSDEVYGKVRIDETTLVVKSGFSRFATRSAFITVDEETADILDSMIQDGDAYPVQGKIVVRESFKPFYDGHEPKRKGKGGDIVTIDGQPVYRETEFVTDMTLEDVMVSSESEKATNTQNVETAVV